MRENTDEERFSWGNILIRAHPGGERPGERLATALVTEVDTALDSTKSWQKTLAWIERTQRLV